MPVAVPLNPLPIERTAALLPHPSASCQAARGVTVRIALQAGDALVLSYRLEGEIAGLRLPAPCAPHRRDGLWRQTCFETFVQRQGEASYCEFNFSPSGEWAAYAFRRYREPGAVISDFDPQIAMRAGDNRVTLDAVIPLAVLPSRFGPGPLRFGLSAVVQEVSGALSHWALVHPGERPDFHDAAAFALEVAAS